MPDRIRDFVASMNLRPSDRVLEVGCGHGVAAGLICALLTTGRYTAVDRSAAMLRHATARNDAFVRAGIAEFVRGDLETVDLGTRRFDKVLAMRVALFHREPARAEALARRWMAPGGRLYVQYDTPGG